MAKSKSVSKTSMDGLANQTPAEMIDEANRLLGSQKMQPTGSVVDDLNKRVKSYCGMFPDSLESLARQAASDLRLKEVFGLGDSNIVHFMDDKGNKYALNTAFPDYAVAGASVPLMVFIEED